MASDDFSIKTKITLDTKNYEAGIKKAESATQKFSSSLSGVTKLLKSTFALAGLAVGTKAIVDFGKSCIKSATQAQKAFNILDNTVKATGADAWTSTKELESASKSLSDSTNYSITEIQKMQSVLLGFTNITGEAFDGASEAVLDMATVMDMDLTSAVQTVGKALDDPITGLDSLRRQGFKFTDEQKAELSQLVKTGKQLEAQKIILDTLATSYGGASKSGQDSFAKQRHAVENYSDALGGKLIPLMKSFAIDNANMIDSLREYLDEIDFNQIGATIKVTFDGIKKGIQNSFEYVKTIFSETQSFMKNIDFKPIVSIINNLISAFEKIGKINLSRITNIIKDLKDSFSGFSENIDLTKFSEVINLIINGFVFLYEEVNKVFDTLLDNIKTFVTNTWNSIKSVFEAGNKALADSETDIKSWGDYFYTAFNNLFKTVQDVIQSISYLLSGDWEIAWQYAKLVVLRIVDGVIDSMTTMVTAFKDKIISILNFAQMLSPFLGTSGKVIKTALSGIEALVDGIDENSKKIKDTMTELVEDTENKIEELTGKPADKNIEELEKFTAGSKNILGEFVDNFKEATDNVKKELDNLSGEYKATNNSMKNDTKSTYKAYSEWDSKLLKQRQDKLSEYSKEYHEINIQLIEQERKKALEDEKNEEERAKINKYYNEEIERFEEAKREKARQTFHIIIAYAKTFLQDTIAGFKKVADTFKKVLSGIGNFVKNTFDKLKNIFSTLFDFNIDDALNNLLKIEDAILTFFVETLPRLPNFFESAFSSVLTLIQTLINSIDWDNVKNILDSIIKTFVTYSPQIVSGIVEVFTNLVSTVSAVLVENAPEIVSAFGEMFFTILEALPSIISNFIKVVGTYLSEIGKYFTNNFDRLSEDLSNIIKSFIDGIAEFISSGGWKNLLDGLLAIQKALEKAITDNIDSIVDTIISALPDLVDMLIESIVSASKTLAKLIRPLIKLIMALIEAIFEFLLSDEVLEASLDVIVELIGAVAEELVPKLAYLIPKLIVKIIGFIIKELPKIIVAIVKGLIEGFVKTNWIEVVKQCFMGFIDGFKDLFGIHSPSKLFEGFGFNIVEGLVNGLKGIAEAVNIILEPLYNFISTVFNGIGETITNIINVSFKGLKDLLDSLLKTIKDLTQISFKGLNDILGTLGSSLKDLTDVSFKGLNDMLGTLGKSLTDITKVSFKGLTDSLDSVGKTLTDITNGSFKGLNDIIGTMNSGLKDLTDVSFKGLKDLLDSSANVIVKITDSVAKLLDSLKGIAEVLPKIPDINLPGLGGGSSGGSGGGSGGGGIFDLGGLLGGGSGGTPIDLTPGGIGELIAKPITGLLGGGSSKPLSTGSDGWDTAIDVLIPGGRQIGGAVKDAFEQASDWVSDAVDSVKDWVDDWWPFANGTNNAPRGLALVGEQGPELVKFNGGEQVINNRNTQKALNGMGGSTNNFNVTFNNLQDTSAFAMMNQLKQYNRQMAINGVI